MAVVSFFATQTFVLDVSVVLLAALSLFMALLIVVLLCLVYFSPRVELISAQRRSTLFLLIGSLILAALFATRLVLASMWLFEAVSLFWPLQFVDVASNAAVGIALLLYVGLPLVASLREKRRNASRTEGAASEQEVPLMYANY